MTLADQARQRFEETWKLNGKYISYAWPGGYPVFYVDIDNNVLCPKCANDTDQKICAAAPNWEDPDLYCDECSQRIESAYAED